MPSTKSARRPRKSATTRKSSSTRVNIAAGRDIRCADFIGRDQHITYGLTPKDVERLLEKALEFWKAGVVFTPYGEDGQARRAELRGETLTFYPEAAQRLARRRDERAYLLSLTLHQDYQVWATRFVPLAAQADVRRVVAGVDIPVAFSEFVPPQEGAGPEARVATVMLQDITQALDKHPAFVILGEPGAGKTTTLQKMAYEAARARLLGETYAAGRVPLFVRLSQQGDRDPFDFLKGKWEQGAGSDFADALAAGRVLVLADGINELSRDERDRLLETWRLFVAEHAGANQMVFTGREKDYDQQLDLPRVRVEPLNDPRIADYLTRNDAEGLAHWLADPNTRLREMAGNPLYLSLLVMAFKEDRRGLANRGALLGWFVDARLERERQREHRGWLPREAHKQALAQMAYLMQRRGELASSLKTARAALPQTIEWDGEELVIKSADLFRFARGAAILGPATETKDVRFYHQLLHEYFAALELLRRFGEGEDQSQLWQCKRRADEMPPASVGEWDPLPEPPPTRWEVTTILACGLARDPTRLIEAVRPHNPALAGRCLDEAGIEKPEAVTKRVRADLLADIYNPAIHLRARLQAGYALGRIDDPRFEPQTISGVKVILPEMRPVPAETYTIGSMDDDPDAFDDERPQHTVDLPAFSIGRWPVTNAEFACFISARGYKDEGFWKTELAKRWLKGEEVTGGQATNIMQAWEYMRDNPDWKEGLERPPDELRMLEAIAAMDEDELKATLTKGYSGKSRERPQFLTNAEYNNPSQPVVGVTWFEAQAYCAWLSAVTGRTYRLPTEAEWEAAARGLPSPESSEGPMIYPWGNEWDDQRANTIEGRVLRLSPVGAYAASGGVGPFGAEDQSGNVWEWTSSLFQAAYPYQPDERENPEAEGERTVRGGSWYSSRRNARCAYRYRLVPGTFYSNLGFRVVSPGSHISAS